MSTGFREREQLSIAIDDRTATVQLQRPIGRFRSGQIRCPALALDRLPRAN